MRLRLIAVGKKMPAWVNDGWQQYAARMPRECRLQLHEIPLARRGRGAVEEGEALLAAIDAGDRVVALDGDGDGWSSEQLADRLGRWLQQGRDVSFLVGGPDGLSEQVLRRADDHWSLSRLTFPHALVRVLVAEQLYRAWSILTNHPYHRA